MNYKRYRYSLVLLAALFIADSVQANEVQLITSHKKSNGTLLRIVTSNRIKDLDNLAGWIGNENWFYVTLNNTRLSDKLGELIEYSSPVISLEVSENRESVQLGFLFERSLEDFEIFRLPFEIYTDRHFRNYYLEFRHVDFSSQRNHL